MEARTEQTDRINPAGEVPKKLPDDKNPFDLSKLRLSQDFAEKVGAKKARIIIPVRKPSRQEFIRVHPDDSMRLETAVLELKEDRETYLVDPALWSELPGEVVPKVLFVTMNRQGVLTLWPIRLPGADGRHDAWNQSALEAARMAMKAWIRLAANMSLGGYEVYQATGDLPEPEWPELSFQEILEIGFKGKLISDLNHPAIRRLRGEI
jgi:hypothetical protein